MSIDIEQLRLKCVPGYTLYGTDTVLPLLNEIESLRTKLDVLQRRTTRHSLAKDLGSAVDADAAIMARITAERDAALGEIEALRNEVLHCKELLSEARDCYVINELPSFAQERERMHQTELIIQIDAAIYLKKEINK